MLESGIIQGSVGKWLSDIILDIMSTYEEQLKGEEQNEQQTKPK